MKHTLTGGIEIAWRTPTSRTSTVTGVPVATLLNPNMFPDISTIRKTTNTRAHTLARHLQRLRRRRGRAPAGAQDPRRRALRPLRGGLREPRPSPPTPGRLERTDDMASPRAALVYQPTDMQTYYFAWGTSFNPSAEAFTLGRQHREHARRSGRTPTRSAPSGSSSRTGSASTPRCSASTRPTRARGARARPSRRSTADSARGFRDRGDRAGPLPNWNIFANYTYLDTEVLESKDVQRGVPVQGKRLIAAPENSGELVVDVRHPRPVTSRSAAALTYVGERAANTSNTNDAAVAT